NSYNYESGIFRDSKVGGDVGYCLDYGLPVPEGTVNFKRYLSPELTSVLANGYPRVSAAQMGLVNNHEAYLATELAIYHVGQQKGDSKNSIMNFDMANLQSTPGYEATVERCFTAAKNMVSKALANPYMIQTPKLEVQYEGAQMKHTDTQIIAGPYKVVSTGYDIAQVVGSLENAPTSAKLTDKEGEIKTTFVKGEDIYIRMSSMESGSTLKANLVAKGTRFVGCAYGNSVTTRQDFGVVLTEEIEKSTSVNLTWKSLVGSIELIKYDQNKDLIKGAKFDLRTQDGATIDTQITGDDGVVRFLDVKPGEYQLVETDTPNGYIMGTKPIIATVKTGEVFKATYENIK
ncbi:MAG: SpaA isopeptide-forming pilin-related protein, partial [Niameybacter sp.]